MGSSLLPIAWPYRRSIAWVLLDTGIGAGFGVVAGADLRGCPEPVLDDRGVDVRFALPTRVSRIEGTSILPLATLLLTMPASGVLPPSSVYASRAACSASGLIAL